MLVGYDAFDMVYDPPETRFLKLAKERGAQIIPGIEMFAHQAARQFEIWTGKPAPWDEMLRVVLLALRENGQTAPRPANEVFRCNAGRPGVRCRSRPCPARGVQNVTIS